MTRFMRSGWFLLLAAVAVVVTAVYALLSKPPSALNWVGVALWVVLLLTLLGRRRGQTPKPRSTRRTRGRRR